MMGGTFKFAQKNFFQIINLRAFKGVKILKWYDGITF